MTFAFCGMMWNTDRDELAQEGSMMREMQGYDRQWEMR
jgi:hypothetical protein